MKVLTDLNGRGIVPHAALSREDIPRSFAGISQDPGPRAYRQTSPCCDNLVTRDDATVSASCSPSDLHARFLPEVLLQDLTGPGLVGPFSPALAVFR